MAKTKYPKSQIIQGGIKITGDVKIKNSKIAGRDNIEKENTDIHIFFAPIYHAINKNASIKPDAKKSLEENVRQIEQEIKKGGHAKASFIQKRIENIRRMAPDIAEVVIATIQNPMSGVGLAVKKVVDKLRTEAN